MKTVVFVGPTLSKEQVLEILPDAIILPPAEQGDVDFARFTMGADVILLIDGVHRQRLSVWQKEVMGILKDGCRFVGASSMGALRAVECEQWGAEPVGEICDWFKNETIDADDEVCLSHGPQSTGYRKLSIPLVNVRASLMSSSLDEVRQKFIIKKTEEMFYPERTWPHIFKVCELTEDEQKHLLAHEIDLKAIDAITALHYVEDLPEPPTGCRFVKNHNKGYGGVFVAIDRKSWTGEKVVREYQIAESVPGAGYNAANRAIAIEFCKVAGILKETTELTKAERFAAEEAALIQARTWLQNAASGLKTVPMINDFLRAVGAYEAVKIQVGSNGQSNGSLKREHKLKERTLALSQ